MELVDEGTKYYINDLERVLHDIMERINRAPAKSFTEAGLRFNIQNDIVTVFEKYGKAPPPLKPTNPLERLERAIQGANIAVSKAQKVQDKTQGQRIAESQETPKTKTI